MHAGVPAVAAPGAGRIVFTGSIAGRLATPLVAPYSASKHAIEAIAETLRHELRSTGIKTVLVEPGAVSTPIWNKARDTADDLDGYPPEALERYQHLITAGKKAIEDNDRRGITADACSAYYEKALTKARPRARYLAGPDAKAGGFLSRVLPDRLRDVFVAKFSGT